MAIRRIDHVGIAVPDLDEALAFYRENFGLIAEHEEINEEQGVREAMLVPADGDPDTARLQLLEPADVLDRAGGREVLLVGGRERVGDPGQQPLGLGCGVHGVQGLGEVVGPAARRGG